LISRRDFLKLSAAAGMSLALRGVLQSAPQAQKATVSLVKSGDRSKAVEKAVELLGVNPVKGKNVVLKPNFNSSHQFPGSTHNDTLGALIGKLSSMGARSFTVADRSGMGSTRAVMQQKGIFDMAKETGFEAVVLDELPKDEWVHFDMKETHWKKGLYFPKMFVEAESIVQTCCLKTHRFGGHFTLSLKNSVGMAAKFSPVDNYNFMNELHSSPDQRLMIAEINLLYEPDLIVLDGMRAFVNQGPDVGKLVEPGVMIAGTDRVAVDTVGVAILRLMGTTPMVSAGKVFDQEQIKRAAELEIGVDSAAKIEIVVPDDESVDFAQKLTPIVGTSIRSVAVHSTGKLNTTWGEIKSV
jgi:uncharacterized protein (DUF362 family)